MKASLADFGSRVARSARIGSSTFAWFLGLEGNVCKLLDRNSRILLWVLVAWAFCASVMSALLTSTAFLPFFEKGRFSQNFYYGAIACSSLFQIFIGRSAFQSCFVGGRLASATCVFFYGITMVMILGIIGPSSLVNFSYSWARFSFGDTSFTDFLRNYSDFIATYSFGDEKYLVASTYGVIYMYPLAAIWANKKEYHSKRVLYYASVQAKFKDITV